MSPTLSCPKKVGLITLPEVRATAAAICVFVHFQTLTVGPAPSKSRLFWSHVFANKSLERRPGKIQIISKHRMALIVVCYVLNFGGLLSRDLLTKKHGTRKVWTQRELCNLAQNEVKPIYLPKPESDASGYVQETLQKTYMNVHFTYNCALYCKVPKAADKNRVISQTSLALHFATTKDIVVPRQIPRQIPRQLVVVVQPINKQLNM